MAPAQERFVSGVAESLREAAEEPGRPRDPLGVYADETPVGFVMISDEVDASRLHPALPVEAPDRRAPPAAGYGTATLDLIVEYFRGRPGVEVLWTSAGQGDGSPIPFYERYGFERTGEIVFDDEVLLRLRLT